MHLLSPVTNGGDNALYVTPSGDINDYNYNGVYRSYGINTTLSGHEYVFMYFSF